jgi:predicted component of type VI protein secretion system
MSDDEVQKLLCDINTRLDQYESRIYELEGELRVALQDIRELTYRID